MRVQVSIAVLVLAVATNTALAQWRENGSAVADNSWRKAWGQHGAMLHLTDKPDELFAAWEKPGAGVPISVVDTAKRGEPVVGVVFFSGCAIDERGFCNAEATFRIFKPDGEPYGEEEHGELWIGKPAPREGELQLSVGAIGVRIERDDPGGTYVVRARLRDNVSGDEVELERTFQVEDRLPTE